MSMPAIRRDVGLMLANVNVQIADARDTLNGAGVANRMRAAGKLSFLQEQKESLEKRLAEIDSHPEASETLFEWIKEEVYSLSMRIEGWIANA